MTRGEITWGFWALIVFTTNAAVDWYLLRRFLVVGDMTRLPLGPVGCSKIRTVPVGGYIGGSTRRASLVCVTLLATSLRFRFANV